MLIVYKYYGLRALEGVWYKQLSFAHKMASVTEKISEEKVSQAEETTETKKHRGIPEALFLVSIHCYTFV